MPVEICTHSAHIVRSSYGKYIPSTTGSKPNCPTEGYPRNEKVFSGSRRLTSTRLRYRLCRSSFRLSMDQQLCDNAYGNLLTTISAQVQADRSNDALIHCKLKLLHEFPTAFARPQQADISSL